MSHTNWIKIQHKGKRIRKEIAISRPKCASLTSLLCSSGIYPIEFASSCKFRTFGIVSLHCLNLGNWPEALTNKPKISLFGDQTRCIQCKGSQVTTSLISEIMRVLLGLAMRFYPSPGLLLIYDKSLTSKMKKAYQIQNVWFQYWQSAPWEPARKFSCLVYIYLKYI